VPRAPLKGGALWGTVPVTVPLAFLGLGHTQLSTGKFGCW
jgi:uncharacterized membrane protein